MTINDLLLVNYCHRSCTPLRNIMRLPKEQAFALARELAEQNRDTTAFYRFADFEHYYPERLRTDALLHARFIALGGRPAQTHPLSFVLQGSDYLDGWFDHGTVTSIPLSRIPAEAVSFTLGDSMASLKRNGGLTMLSKDMLFQTIRAFDGAPEDFLADAVKRYHYIEAQVWDDACLGL
ncbi:MAG: hypothetical protein J1E43_03185 [Christensenellaceae bacterium]|nr:hypothetical protein [Christensenellaceae bacterium]